MEAMIRTRVQLRERRLTETMEKAKKILKACEEGSITTEVFTRIRLTLKQDIDMFDKEVRSFIEHYTGEDSTSLCSAYTELQIKAEELVVEFTTIDMLQRNFTPRMDNSTQPTTSKLPKLEMAKFNGNILQWSEFWDRFEANVACKNLKDVEKLAYESIQGLCTTNANYQVAIDTLRDRFGKAEKVVDAHYSALNDIAKCGDNTRDCRKTLNNIERHLRVLHSLGEKVDSNQLRVTLMSKFPERVKYQVSLLTPDDYTVTTLRRSLDQVITAMERGADASPSTSSSHFQQQDGSLGSTTEALHVKAKPRPHRGSKLAVSLQTRQTRKRKNISQEGPVNKKPKSPCMFCDGEHYSSSCPKVKTIEERKRKLGDRCHRCFRKGHVRKDCKQKRKCFHCKKDDHHQALCPKICGMQDLVPSSLAKDIVCNLSNSLTYLQTAVVKLKGPSSNKMRVGRLLLDSGSQRSYITARAAKELQLTTDKEDLLMIYTFGCCTPKETLSPSTEVLIETKRGIKRTLKVNVVPRITDRLPVPNLKTGSMIDIVADDGSVGHRIDLLIGNDYYFSFMRSKNVHVNENLYLIDTEFGWIISGNTVESVNYNALSVVTYCQCHQSGCPYFTEPDLPLRNVDIKFLWTLESIGITDSPKVTRDEETVKYFNETVHYKNGRYEVKWPWIQYPPDLPTNFGLACGRLRSLLKRIDKENILEYNNILTEQLEANIIEVVEAQANTSTGPVHYLPHHMVKQQGKRGRIVYDASAKVTGQKSLNECLYRGPSLLEDLTALLLNFRIKRTGVMADVEKAFLQVGLQAEDRDVTRFLWIKDPEKEATNDNLLHMRFCRVPFGIISSPFLLTATVRHHMSLTNKKLLKDIADKCYVDNLVTSVDSTEAAQSLYKQSREAFQQLSMNIRDWVSNNEQFLQSIPEQHKAKQSNEVKVLGLSWDVNKDLLKLKISKENLETETMDTKRKVLKTLARVYDPCGFVAPLILPAKLLFQETCRRKLKWDTELPTDLKLKLDTVMTAFKTASEVELPRYVGTAEPNEKVEYQLHCFTDASQNAYAAAVYLRSKGEQEVKSTLIMAKSRVTPLEEKDELKIPKLELLGFLIGSRLLKYVANVLELHIQKRYLWTDSQVVLSWIKSNKLLPPFISRRVNEIKQNQDTEMFYINTNLNPADIATRPELWNQKTQLWFNGPEFLSKNESSWPDNRNTIHNNTLLSVGEALDMDGPEFSSMEETDTGDIERASLEIDSTDVPIQEEEASDNSHNEQSCTKVAEIIKLQNQYFPEETAGKETHLSRNLGLYKDVDGVLRCRGRMTNTSWPYDMKHPVLIPKDCAFTNKIIQETHTKNYHVGVSHTLNIIRQNYWIPQGRVQVQRIIKKCPQCLKHGGGPYKLPSTPALPAERVNYSSPFTFTGVDYFGPMYVNTNNGKVKRWVCLFTCLAVRAIHLEIVKDLTAEECLLALRRFIATRGLPQRIVSDNALQFKLTSEVLEKAFCIDNNIKWKFIPQLAPWHGGFYERLVALVKHCLKRTLEKHLLNATQLVTVIKEVESVLNSRPLTCVGSEPEHVLKPADFLSMGKYVVVDSPTLEIPVAGSTTKLDLIQGWKKGLKVLEEFKSMFMGQYLTSLREKYKYSYKQPRVLSHRQPKLGDTVQIKGNTKNRENWKVGKIISLLKGSDGECRVAKVKVGNDEFTRSVGHLYPLEAELQEDQIDNQDAIQADADQVSTSQRAIHPDPSQTSISTQPTAVDHMLPDEDVNPLDVSESQTVDEPMDIDILDSAAIDDTIPPIPYPNPDQAVQTDTTSKQTEEVSPQQEEALPGRVDEEEEPKRMRVAAARAREKIAEWTRHLLALL